MSVPTIARLRRAHIGRLRENLIDETIAVQDARLDVDRAVYHFRSCVARRDLTARELAAARAAHRDHGASA